MNLDELAQLRTNIERVHNLSIGAHLSNQFPTEDLSSLRFRNYSGGELISLTERLVAQFLAELDGPNARFWPRGFVWGASPQEMAPRDLLQTVKQFASSVGNQNWDAVAQILELLIGYQIQSGFWDRGSRRLHSVNKIRQRELFAELETKEKQLTVLLQQVNGLKNDVAQVLGQREADRKAVAQQLEAAQKQATEASSLVAKINGYNGQVTEIVNAEKENLEKTKGTLSEIEKTKEQLALALKNAEAKLTTSEERLAFMEEKHEIVNEIAGTAAAGLLGQKFEARRKELAKSSGWWMTGTVISVFISAIWLAAAHKYVYQTGGDAWTTFALNFGLLLPAIFLVGFFGTQFQKVRHFEEEYAFRSAVSMTLGAFVDRLKGAGERHDKLIEETVEKLYRLPILLQEKEHGGGWFKQRAVERTLKTAVELVKEVKTPLDK
jgi:hypothetical protein